VKPFLGERKVWAALLRKDCQFSFSAADISSNQQVLRFDMAVFIN